MAQPVSRFENLRTLQVANVDVAFATAFVTLVSGTFLIGFIQHLGGSDLWVGLAMAVPSFIGLLQIPGAIWGRRYPNYKGFVSVGGWIWRLLHIPLIFLPLLHMAGETRLFILIACIGVATAAVQIVGPIYNDWMAELVPEKSRGWYFSRRTSIATAIGMGVGFIAGVGLDQFRAAGRADIGFSALFGAGVFCALVSMYFFLRMTDTERANPIRASLKQSLAVMVRPIRDRDFQRVLAFTVVFVFGQTFANGLFIAFGFESLDLSYTVVQLTQVAHAVGTVAFVKVWGYLADKYGNKPVLAILGTGIILTPGVWILCEPGRPAMNAAILILGHLFNGVVWSGVTVCQLNLYMATAKAEDRPNYLGMALAVQAVVGGIAPIVGAGMMSVLRGAYEAEIAYKTVFATVMGLRVLALLSLLPVKEEGSTTIRRALQQLRRVSPSGISALRKIAHSPDEVERLTAIREVGAARFTLATDELIKALADPSPAVRRQAASALAKLGNPTAASDLARYADENPILVEEEMLEALGELGDRDSVPVLAKFLSDPRAMLRRSAAKALGRIGDHTCIEPLMRAAAQPGDPDLRRASLQALRALGATSAAAVIADSLFDPHPSVRVAAAEAIAELDLKSLAPVLRQSMEWLFDEAGSELAYALGRVGDKEDVPAILEVAAHAVSPTTRRRAVLGVACLYGVESQVYRLMMLDGMSRDAELMHILRPSYRGSKRLRDALERYSSGDEAGALAMLASSKRRRDLAPLAETPVEEAFLVAALAYAQRES